MNLPAYPETAPSGFQGLGTLPKNWEVIRGRFVMQVNPPAPCLRLLRPEDEVSFVPMEAVGEYGGLSLGQTRALVDVSSGYTEFQDGDVVVAKITPCFENGKAALARGLMNGAAYGTTELHVLRAGPKLDRGFLFYVAISDRFRKLGESEMYGAGGQKRVPPEFNKDFPMPMPSLPEQQQIAEFLDWQTGEIDALIARKRELLTRLKEMRIAVITEAVTRGLNPAAPLRDSGVLWLGQVPKHWEVRRLKFTASEPLQYGANEPAELDDQDCPRYIRITDIKEDGTLHEDTFRSLSPAVAEPYLLQDGDLLLARSGATVGKTFQYLETWGKAAYAGYLIRFRVDPALLSARFAYYFLRSEFYWACINASLIQATIQNFSAEKYANIDVPLPPLTEQEAIVGKLEEEKAKTDKLEDAITQVISCLTEYRNALITAATTGKIDVRNVKIPKAVA